jgi:lysophospholipase L1-like esterase
MMLGDSITSNTCYPQYISRDLISSGHTNFQFLGTVQNNQACSATNVQTEGHGGSLVTSLVTNGVASATLQGWLTNALPEIVVMHFGTNDIWSNQSPTNILTAYSGVIDAARAAVPNVIFFVAQIIPMAPTNCVACAARVTALNAVIPDWAASKSTSTSPIYVVDLWTGIDAATDTVDGVHPNFVGSQKMSNVLTPAITSKNLF